MLTILSEARADVVEAGEELQFGREGGGTGSFLGISSDARVHRVLGKIQCLEEGWRLENLGRWINLLVADQDGPGQDLVAVGTSQVIAWERTTVSIALDAVVVSFAVHCDRPLVATVLSAATGSETVRPAQFDEQSGYFRVLVALCEQRLNDSRLTHLPTSAQIAVRLNALNLEDGSLTAKGVNRRIDYCRLRLGLESRAGEESRYARQELVDVALRLGIVSRAHLRILVPDPLTASQ